DLELSFGQSQHFFHGLLAKRESLIHSEGVYGRHDARPRQDKRHADKRHAVVQGEVRKRQRKNVMKARSFAEMLEQTIRRYQNRAIEAVQVIEELIHLAKDMREANARGEALRLSEDELAFYDALETNDSEVKVLGEP